MSIKRNIVSLIFVTLFTSQHGFAAEGETLYQEKGCATCHGPAGKSVAPIWPNLAGQHKQYLITQIKDIKSGKRNNGMSVSMQPMVTNITDEEIEKISDWLSTL